MTPALPNPPPPPLTEAEKIRALMDQFGYTEHEARAILVDMGEIEEGNPRD